MAIKRGASDEAAIKRAVKGLKALIRTRFPTATFEVGAGDDPPGTHVVASVDTDNLWDLIDLVSPLVMEIQLEQRLPVYVVPSLTPERAAERMRAMKAHALPPLFDEDEAALDEV